MDPDFRENLFHLGKAMDAAGIDWTILSAFRDDYRQGLAVGLKAHAGNSFHGGSAATGGYGHGCAVDLADTDRDHDSAVWNWLDQHGDQFGLFRPLRAADPAHIQARPQWRAVAANLRKERIGASRNSPDEAGGTLDGSFAPIAADAGLTEDQFNCRRAWSTVEADKKGRHGGSSELKSAKGGAARHGNLRGSEAGAPIHGAKRRGQAT
jgi:hypothetical protein